MADNNAIKADAKRIYVDDEDHEAFLEDAFDSLDRAREDLQRRFQAKMAAINAEEAGVIKATRAFVSPAIPDNWAIDSDEDGRFYFEDPAADQVQDDGDNEAEPSNQTPDDDDLPAVEDLPFDDVSPAIQRVIANIDDPADNVEELNEQIDEYLQENAPSDPEFEPGYDKIKKKAIHKEQNTDSPRGDGVGLPAFDEQSIDDE